MCGMDERITDMEIRYMHMQRTVEELNEVVYRQQQTIDRLEGEMKVLKEQMNLILPSLSKGIEEEEPPPHY